MTSQRRRRPSGRRRWGRGDWIAMVAATIVGAIVVVAALRVADRDDAAPDDLVDDPGVAHVHGLGVNPADGALIVATHYGSFRIAADGDEADRIGTSLQDTMGFTVVGPDHFLGSGHPDVAGSVAGQPGPLGLIESTDAGASWTALSLRGRADREKGL